MGATKDVDWNAIKNAYISDPESSYRSLAREFDVSLGAIHRHAKEGKWTEKREQFGHKVETLTLEKLIAERAKSEAKRLKQLYTATDKLSAKILDGIKKVNPKNTLAIRQLTSSLKELMAIEGVSTATENGDTEDQTGGVVVLSEILPELKPPEDEPSEEAVTEVHTDE